MRKMLISSRYYRQNTESVAREMTISVVVRNQNIDCTESFPGHGAVRTCFSLLPAILSFDELIPIIYYLSFVQIIIKIIKKLINYHDYENCK